MLGLIREGNSKSFSFQLFMVLHSFTSALYFCLALSWQWSLWCRNQSIDLRRKSMDWLLYGRNLRHERFNFSNTNLQRKSKCVNTLKIIKIFFNPIQLSVSFHIETSYLFYFAEQKNGFYLWCNSMLKWFKK